MYVGIHILNCFRFNEEGMEKSHTDASLLCETNGGKLYEPSNLQENNLTADHALALNGNYWHWIGITDSETEGKWLLESSKTTIPFENWQSGEPNNHMGNQECGKMKVRSSSADHGKWDDRSCSDPYRFICEL